MKIIECFPFNDEVTLLELKLEILNDCVDYFVIVESELTQARQPKVLYYNENKHLFEKFAQKIEHVILRKEEVPTENQGVWSAENYQRNAILKGLEKLNLNDDDLISIGDCDEIVASEIYEYLREEIQHSGNKVEFPVAVEMDFAAYYINLITQQRKWIGNVISTYQQVKQWTPQGLRAFKDSLDNYRGGIHASWLGGAQQIYKKSKLSCIEPFDKNAIATLEQIEEKFNYYKENKEFYFIHPENIYKTGETKFELVDEDYPFPEYLLNNKSKYIQLFI